jgi:hypothetical protein
MAIAPVGGYRMSELSRRRLLEVFAVGGTMIDSTTGHQRRRHQGAVSPDVALRDLNTPQVDAWCAHNATFEQLLFAGAGKPWICSL